MLGDRVGDAQDITGVGFGELEFGAGDEFEAVDGDTDAFKSGLDDARVVASAMSDELDGRFQVVEEAVDICALAKESCS